MNSLYTPTDVRHTFTTKFNEVVDCIDFQAQPSVKAAAKAGITLNDEGPPVSPPSLPVTPAVDPSVALNGQLDSNGNARSCPKGSVPYPRVTAATIQAAGGLTAYLSGLKNQTPRQRPPPPGNPTCLNTKNGFAWSTANDPVNNLGMTMTAAVYKPSVAVGTNCGNPAVGQKACEHSLAQLWVTTGSCQSPSSCTTGATGNAIQSVELGWHVAPDVEHDTNTHLFVYSTQNGYNLTAGSGNCYNLNCSQFVQTSSPQFYPGQTVTGIVGPGGSAPIEGAFQAFNLGPTAAAQYQNWYIYIDGFLIGYYPSAITFFGTMQTSATAMQTGGEVFPDYVNAPYDDVQMGSGFQPPSFGFSWGAYIRDIYYLQAGSGSGSICGTALCGNGYCYTDPTSAWAVGLCGYQASNFYGASTIDTPGGSQPTCWGPYFYYGGG